MGKPGGGYTPSLRKEREPGELKHLSSLRKRKDSASSGERKRRSLNRSACRPGMKDSQQARGTKSKGLGRPTGKGESPVDVGKRVGEDPE